MTVRVARLPFVLDPLMAEAKRRARQRRVAATAALVVIAIASVVVVRVWNRASPPPTRAQVTMVSAIPWPEGPLSLVAAAPGSVNGALPLSAVEKLIPTTLPKNPVQSCKVGAMVLLTLRGGRVLTYGPCERPASIERLRLALIKDALKR